MRAVVFADYETFPKLEEVDRPIPGPGEVLLKVAGAGACHSDVSIYNAPKGSPSALTPPFTLGHENSGWVEEVGPGVSGVPIGDAFLVYGSIGCGHCANCAAGAENYCLHAAEPPLGTGLGYNGGMAEYVAVPARHLVPLGDADPIPAAPLTDAALTPYHAIKASLPQLAGGGRYALVIGLGGLGQIAVQILRALTGATILATDLDEGAMRRAEAKGAVRIPGGEEQVAAIREHTGGRGVDAAFDFVGAAPTIKMAQASMALGGRLTVAGIANGQAEWTFFSTPFGALLTNTYWGTLPDLHEVVAMYRAGQIVPEIERFDFDHALHAYHRLEDGTMTARAVIVPNAT